MGFDRSRVRELTDAQITVRINGQPPSGNHMYDGYGRDRRKKSEVASYQAEVVRWTRYALSAGWQPGERIVVNYWFNLTRDIDCTNIIKVVEDGIAEALCPGIDPPRCCRKFDTRFLPRAIEKITGAKQPFVQFELHNE